MTEQTSISTIGKDEWFDEIIHNLKVDKFTISAGVASEETNQFYDVLKSGDALEIYLLHKNLSEKLIIKNILNFYYHQLIEQNVDFEKVAFDFTNTELLAWFEIKDNDEQSEDKILMAEAITNAKFYQAGFTVSAMIVEKSDFIKIPSHYKVVPNQSNG